MNARSPIALTPRVARRSGESLLEWVDKNVEEVWEHLERDGAVWFRGFGTGPAGICEQALQALECDLMDDVFWSTPRSRVENKTFTATSYPPRETIPLHSEMSYLERFPRLLCFHSITAAATGGATTVANLDSVSRELGDLVAEFYERRVAYVRIFRSGIDIPISTAFGTEDDREVQRIAEAQGMSVEKLADDSVRLSYTAQGALVDPRHDSLIWFNQAHLQNPANLDSTTRSALETLYGEPGMPRQSYFGDGEPIAEELLRTVSDVFARHTVPLNWRDNDLVIIDNLRWAHGRSPFSGERELQVAMGQPVATGRREGLRR